MLEEIKERVKRVYPFFFFVLVTTKNTLNVHFCHRKGKTRRTNKNPSVDLDSKLEISGTQVEVQSLVLWMWSLESIGNISTTCTVYIYIYVHIYIYVNSITSHTKWM